MHSDVVKVFFTNLLFVVGVVLLIVGFSIGANTLAKSLIFPQYPLKVWDETRCEYDMWPVEDVSSSQAQQLSPEALEYSNQQKKARLDSCQASIAQQRVTQQVEDSVTAITLLISGLLLTLFFKGFIKVSKS